MKLFSFVTDYFFTNILKLRIKPKVIQLPITNCCNSKCVTCNIWKMKDKSNVNPAELKLVLSDSFFSRVEVVGVNGGEPSLHPQFVEVVESLFVLKKLKRVHIISNAMNTDFLIKKMKVVKKLCEEKKVKLFLTVSVDGIDEVHDRTRGISGAFDKTVSTLKTILSDKCGICDVLDVGCTISNSNTGMMIAVQSLCKKLGVGSYYHLAVPNERIGTFEDAPYSVLLNRRNSILAEEFFYGEFKYSGDFKSKFRNFISYNYLAHGGKNRSVPCQYLRRDVTIDQELNFALCACAGKILGNLIEKPAKEIIKSAAKKEIVRLSTLCDSCIHYIVYPSMKSIFYFFMEKYSGIIWIRYKIASVLCWRRK